MSEVQALLYTMVLQQRMGMLGPCNRGNLMLHKKAMFLHDLTWKWHGVYMLTCDGFKCLGVRVREGRDPFQNGIRIGPSEAVLGLVLVH